MTAISSSGAPAQEVSRPLQGILENLIGIFGLYARSAGTGPTAENVAAQIRALPKQATDIGLLYLSLADIDAKHRWVRDFQQRVFARAFLAHPKIATVTAMAHYFTGDIVTIRNRTKQVLNRLVILLESASNTSCRPKVGPAIKRFSARIRPIEAARNRMTHNDLIAWHASGSPTLIQLSSLTFSTSSRPQRLRMYKHCLRLFENGNAALDAALEDIAATFSDDFQAALETGRLAVESRT